MTCRRYVHNSWPPWVLFVNGVGLCGSFWLWASDVRVFVFKVASSTTDNLVKIGSGWSLLYQSVERAWRSMWNMLGWPCETPGCVDC